MTETTLPSAPGTYRLHCGGASFYIGSTFDIAKRWIDHRWRLRKGEHPVPKLQAAYWAEMVEREEGDDDEVLRMEVVEVIDRKPYEEDEKLRKRLRLHEQWLLDAEFGSEGCCNRSRESGYNYDNSQILRGLWRDPEFRARQVKRLRARKGDAVTAETREKMSVAKRGRRNYKAKPCWLDHGGKRVRFDTVTEAAEWAGVKQQVMDLWMRGKVPWPGSGKRASRYPELEGMRGGFEG